MKTRKYTPRVETIYLQKGVTSEVPFERSRDYPIEEVP